MQFSQTQSIVALTILLAACGRISDSIDKNWSGHSDQAEAEAEVPSTAAPAARADSLSYSFVASRRHDEPAGCGARLLALQLVFPKNLTTVSALLSSQAWPCSDLDYDGSAYYFLCAPPAPNNEDEARFDASIMIVLFEAPPNTQITGEAVLTLGAAPALCEHTYALDGKLDY